MRARENADAVRSMDRRTAPTNRRGEAHSHSALSQARRQGRSLSSVFAAVNGWAGTLRAKLRRRAIRHAVWTELQHAGFLYAATPMDWFPQLYPKDAHLWGSRQTHGRLIFASHEAVERAAVPLAWVSGTAHVTDADDAELGTDLAEALADLLNSGKATYDWRSQAIVATRGRWRAVCVRGGDGR